MHKFRAKHLQAFAQLFDQVIDFSLKTCVILLVLAATQLSCGGGGSSGSNAAPPSSSPVPKMSHVFLVVEENHSFNSVIGSPDMPFLNGLLPQAALATQYFAN